MLNETLSVLKIVMMVHSILGFEIEFKKKTQNFL